MKFDVFGYLLNSKLKLNFKCFIWFHFTRMMISFYEKTGKKQKLPLVKKTTTSAVFMISCETYFVENGSISACDKLFLVRFLFNYPEN